jgi:hypothetical protein
LEDWVWESHRGSRLYTDVWRAIYAIQHTRRSGYDIDLRLTTSELSCAMLLTRDNLFVEQYAYGRSRNFEGGVTLGGEYAVFEYERLERADGRGTKEPVRDVLPIRAGIAGLPHPARAGAEVEHRGVQRVAGDGHHPAPPIRSDAAPFQGAQQFGVDPR